MQLFNNKILGSSRLVIFVLGWASGKNTLGSFDLDNSDICSLYDYRDMNVPDELYVLADRYDECYIVAWSFGVYVSQLIAPNIVNLKKIVAVNGTPKPSDDVFGIPCKALSLTSKSVLSVGMDKFYKRMCRESYDCYVGVDRSDEELSEELNKLCALFLNPYIPIIKWSSVIIGSEDLIFPTKNMDNYWNIIDCDVEKCDIPHYSFGVLGVSIIKRHLGLK